MDQMFRLHLHHIRLLHIRRSDFAFILIRCSDFICITFANSADQTFRLRLLRIRRSDFAFILISCSDFICITFASLADQTFTLRLLHIMHSDFAFIWIKCSDFICITFSSTAIRRSHFVFCISGVQTSPSDGSDVQTSSVSQQIRRSDFVFCISGVQTSPSYGSDVQTSSVSHFLTPQSDVQTSSSAYQAFRLRLNMDQMFTPHLQQIRRSDFVFCTGVQTSPSLDQMFRLHLYHVF